MRCRRVVLRSHVRPGHSATESDFDVQEDVVPAVTDGEMLIEVLYLSVDPYLRRCLTPHTSPRFPPTISLGTPPISRGVGRVLQSRRDDFDEGDLVVGSMRWENYTVTNGRDGFGAAAHLTRIDPHIGPHVSRAIGVQGLTGLNAYFGVLDVARPKTGEVMVVSGAAGGIGSIAGQIARLAGAVVIGIAGSDDKCGRLVGQLGFDHALNYRSPSLGEQIEHVCPHGPDIYFDNVGGELSQTVMWTMRHPARIVECGQIASYDSQSWLVDIYPIHANRLTLMSVLGSAYARYFPAAIAQLGHWLDTGELVAPETVSEGLAAAPGALAGLFRGANFGKSLIHIAD